MGEVIEMCKQTCKSCSFYRQHYILNEKKLVRIYCGHCVYKKPKTRKPDSTICDEYIEKRVDEEAFASREYLTKALLEYMFRLELLPDIENQCDGLM